MRRTFATALAVVAGFGVALPSVHLAFRPSPHDAASRAPELLASQLDAWGGGRREVDRDVNPEWDLGHATFFVLTLANVALAAPAGGAARDAYRATADEVIDDVRGRSPAHYHLPYFAGGALRQRGAGSLFMEGEIVMMEASRLVAWPGEGEARAPRGADLEARAERVVREMSASPALLAESYPDECWMFDNAMALAALAVAGRALGHPVAGADELTRRWLARAKERIDPHTGLLVASTTWDGATLDGPEASSAFAVAHLLDVIDPALARDQYARARAQLVARPLGFAYAREWPDAALWHGDALPPRAGRADVDSGPIVPLLGASAGASGMAFLGAHAFADAELEGELSSSLELAAFPERSGPPGEAPRAGARSSSGSPSRSPSGVRLRYAASNTLGDAVLLYALVQGPLWRAVRASGASS